MPTPGLVEVTEEVEAEGLVELIVADLVEEVEMILVEEITLGVEVVVDSVELIVAILVVEVEAIHGVEEMREEEAVIHGLLQIRQANVRN